MYTVYKIQKVDCGRRNLSVSPEAIGKLSRLLDRHLEAVRERGAKTWLYDNRVF